MAAHPFIPPQQQILLSHPFFLSELEQLHSQPAMVFRERPTDVQDQLCVLIHKVSLLLGSSELHEAKGL